MSCSHVAAHSSDLEQTASSLEYSYIYTATTTIVAVITAILTACIIDSRGQSALVHSTWKTHSSKRHAISRLGFSNEHLWKHNLAESMRVVKISNPAQGFFLHSIHIPELRTLCSENQSQIEPIANLDPAECAWQTGVASLSFSGSDCCDTNNYLGQDTFKQFELP